MHRWALFVIWCLCLFGNRAVQAQVVATDTLAEILKTGVLKACIWPDYFGISYHNPRSGKFQGVDIELSRALAKDLGVKLEYVETDFGKLLDDMQQGKCQIAMMGVAVLPSRALRVDFSQPYLRGDAYAVTTLNNTAIKTWSDLDQPGRVISVLKGTFLEPLMRSRLKHASLLVADQPGERERDVESGRADVFITDYPYSQRMLANTDWARVIAPDSPVQMTDYAYAVPKNNPIWLARVNAFVSQIKKDGRLKNAAAPNNLLPMIITE